MKGDLSVIIPVKDDAREEDARRCFKALGKQSVKATEIIIVTKTANPKLLKTLRKNTGVRIFMKDLKKSEARNFGAKKSKGKYLVHIDINDAPQKQAFKEALTLYNDGKTKAVVMNEWVNGRNIISRIRRLERKLNMGDKSLITPQIIERELFDKIGGFDSEVDILDDWSLHYRLERVGTKTRYTKAYNIIAEEENLIEILKRKYLRGKYIPLFVKKYPEYGDISNAKRLGIYIKGRKSFSDDVIATFGFLVLKPLEWLAWFAGSLRPLRENLYQRGDVAMGYDNEQKSSNCALYKDYAEKRGLRQLLSPVPKTAIEIGAGSGRITKELTKLGVSVTATEPSGAMIKEFRKNQVNAKVIKMAGEDYLRRPGEYELALAIRVVWHIEDQEKRNRAIENMFKYASRWVILDFANGGRHKNMISYPLLRIAGIYKQDYFFSLDEIEKIAHKNGARIEKVLALDMGVAWGLKLVPKKKARKLFGKVYYLEQGLARIIPPGRWLVKFDKVTSNPGS